MPSYSTGFLTFTLGTAAYSLDSLTVYTFSHAQGQGFNIQRDLGNQKNFPFIGISGFSETAVGTNASDFTVSAPVDTASLAFFFTNGSEVINTAVNDVAHQTWNLHLTVESKTDNFISGSFSGKVNVYDKVDDPLYLRTDMISNGKFQLSSYVQKTRSGAGSRLS